MYFDIWLKTSRSRIFLPTKHAKCCSLRCWLIRKIFCDLLSTVCCRKKPDINKWKGRTRQIPEAMSLRRLNFTFQCLIFLCPQYGSCCMSPFRPPTILRWLLGFWKVSMHLCKGKQRETFWRAAVSCMEMSQHFPYGKEESKERTCSWIVTSATRFKPGSRQSLNVNTNQQM
jgi:hypothetical protein